MFYIRCTDEVSNLALVILANTWHTIRCTQILNLGTHVFGGEV